MAEHAVRPPGEQGSDPPPEQAEVRAPDREHAGRDRMQPTVGDTVLHGATPEAQLGDLRAMRHAVLGGGEERESAVALPAGIET